jgi:ribosome-binding ATPase YchF (GTP1/OBG family)
VISFDELEEIGNWDVAKAAKKLRLEGKDYVVSEGDVIHFRFAV